MNLHARVSRASIAVALGAVLLGFFGGQLIWAGPLPGGGCGHDSNLDSAELNLEKAYALVSVSVNPGVTPPFGGHDVRALRAIELARDEVAAAIDFAEHSCQ